MITIHPKTEKIGIFGITGSGKTYFAENGLLHHFKKPFVYLIHPEDFQNCGANVTTYTPRDKNGFIDRSPEHLDLVMKEFNKRAKKGEFDAFIITESSSILPKNYESLKKYVNIIDSIDSHRHYGLEKGQGYALCFEGRRPQALCTEITGNLYYTFLFATESAEVKEKMKTIDARIIPLMPRLRKHLHNFILKEIGEEPILCDSFNVMIIDEKEDLKK